LIVKIYFPLAIHAGLLWALTAFASAALAQGNAPAAPTVCRDKKLPAPFDAEGYAIDGATLVVTGFAPHVRLWGIRAPALRDKDRQETMPGMAARAGLEDLLDAAAHKIHVAATGWDRECRLVAIVTNLPTSMPDGSLAPRPPVAVDIGLAMLSLGFAYGFPLDEPIRDRPELGQTYAHAEAQARKTSGGLWPFWLGETERTPRQK
jgi:endonuclease YncB( thermonuclease family)